jgi:class 3 adenylate cyclase
MSAEQPPYGSENRTVICTVVFVDLVDYSRRPVAQQVVLKRHLNELINRALAQVAESDRLALDTGDGAALCFFGDPEDALFAAANLRQAVKAEPGPGLEIRIGINLGPTRVVRDLNGNRNLIGDGINVAQRVMGFAAPNQILVSRSFYEVVSRLSEEYARLFHYFGLHRDKHVREHELYEVHGVTAPGGAVDTEVEPAGPTSTTLAPEPVAFPAELLGQVTRALARHLGPMASVVVERAARQARDTEELVAAAADSLTGPARRAFLGEVSTAPGRRSPSTSAAGGPEPLAPSGPPAPRPRVPAPITPAVLAAAETRLASHIGPIARVLVAQAAKHASDTVELAERLAVHIDDPAKRAAFLNALGSPDT